MEGRSFAIKNSRQKRVRFDMKNLTIIGNRKPRKNCHKINIKTKILNKIENFSSSDEDIEQHVKNKLSEEVSCHENSEQILESDCQRNASVSLPQRQMDEYALKEYIVTRGNLMCNVCRIEFPNDIEFKIHMIRESHGKLFQCGFCLKRFSRSSTLEHHLRVHFIPKLLACRQCELQFQSKDALRKHQTEAHFGRKTIECSGCKKKSTRFQSLGDRKLIHTNVKPRQCPICGKNFQRLGNLRTDMIVHSAHSPFACDLCPAKFKRLSVLKTHNLTHTGVRRFECDICKQRFHLKGALKQHILAHYDIKPYKCEDCDKNYRRS